VGVGLNDQAAAQGRPEITPHDFGLWLVSQAESNALEGEYETAARLRELAAMVANDPDGFRAYMKERAVS
jgi:hypothetical protein